MKTPPPKQEEKEITSFHLAGEGDGFHWAGVGRRKEAEEEEDNKEHYLAFVLSSGLFLSLEKSLRGSIPKRKVTAATPNRINT